MHADHRPHRHPSGNAKGFATMDAEEAPEFKEVATAARKGLLRAVLLILALCLAGAAAGWGILLFVDWAASDICNGGPPSCRGMK